MTHRFLFRHVKKIGIFLLLACICFQSACTSHKFDAHFSPQLIPSENLNDAYQAPPIFTPFYPRSIAVLLPLSNTLLSQSAMAIQNGFLAAYYQDKETSNQTPPVIRFYDISQPQEAIQVYKKALEEGAEAIVGPITKEASEILISSELPQQIPTLVLNYSYSEKKSPQLFQLGLSPEDELSQLTKFVWKSGHHRAAIFASEDAWGNRLQAAFKHYWKQFGGEIVAELFLPEDINLSETIRTFLYPTTDHASFTKESDAHQTELTPQPNHRQDIDFIVFLLSPEKARQVLPLLNYYYAQDIPVYATSYVYSEIASTQNKDLNGLTFCDMPWLLNPPLHLKWHKVHSLLLEGLNIHSRFFALGFDAYAIIRHFKTFEQNRSFKYEGLTGTLFLDEENRFHRILMWAKFQNGYPVVLP